LCLTALVWVPGDPPEVELHAHNQHHHTIPIFAPTPTQWLSGRLPMNASHSFKGFAAHSAIGSVFLADPVLASFPPLPKTSNSPLSHDPASPNSATMGHSQEEFPDLNGMGLYAATITGDGKSFSSLSPKSIPAFSVSLCLELAC